MKNTSQTSQARKARKARKTRKARMTRNKRPTTMKQDKNIFAAIALALHEFKGNNVHEKEPGIITIKPRHTLWNAKFQVMTQKP